MSTETDFTIDDYEAMIRGVDAKLTALSQTSSPHLPLPSVSTSMLPVDGGNVSNMVKRLQEEDIALQVATQVLSIDIYHHTLLCLMIVLPTLPPSLH